MYAYHQPCCRCRRIKFRESHVGGIYEVNQKQHISILNTESAELQRQMNANLKNFHRKKRTSLHHTTSQEVEILARQ